MDGDITLQQRYEAVGRRIETACRAAGRPPDQVTLLAGQTQQMAVSGSPSLPLTWTVLNPAVATISPTGLLTAVHSGVTQVRATDNIGSTDVNTLVRVYDFKATLGTVTTRPGTTVRVPLLSDRGVGALGIVSEQLKVTWSGTGITGARTTNSSLWSEWGANPGVRVTTPNSSIAATHDTTVSATTRRSSCACSSSTCPRRPSPARTSRSRCRS